MSPPDDSSAACHWSVSPCWRSERPDRRLINDNPGMSWRQDFSFGDWMPQQHNCFFFSLVCLFAWLEKSLELFSGVNIEVEARTGRPSLIEVLSPLRQTKKCNLPSQHSCREVVVALCGDKKQESTCSNRPSDEQKQQKSPRRNG